MIPTNPFVAGSIITDRAKFIGRKEIVKNIIDSLNNHNRIVLYGQRRVGKSSILHQVKQELESSMLYMPIYIDLQGKLNTSLNELVVYIVRTINKCCNLGEIMPKNLTVSPIDHFKNTWLSVILSNLPKILSGNGKEFQKLDLVLLLDEFDDSNQSALSKNAVDFYSYLSQLLGKYYQLKIVVVLSRSPEYLSEAAKHTIKGCKSIRVSLMTKEEISELTTLSEPYLKWSTHARNALWDFTKGHPFLAQSFCSKVWDKYMLGEKIESPEATRDDVELVSQGDEFSHIIDNDWSNLYPQERVLVCLLSSSTGRTSLLKIWETIEKNNLESFYISPDTIDQKRSKDDYLGSYRTRKNDYLRTLLDNLVDSDWIESVGWEHTWLEIKIPVFRQWVSSNYQLRFLLNDLFDKQKRADMLFLKASRAENDERAIDIMEEALAENPENEKVLHGLLEKLKGIIQLCFDGDNYPLAQKYAARLSNHDPDAAKKYLTRAENEIRKRLLLRRITIDITNHHFIDAYQQANLLGVIDARLQHLQRINIAIELISFVLCLVAQSLLYWFRNILFLLPLLMIAVAFQTNAFDLKSPVLGNRNLSGITIVLALSIFATLVEIRQEQSIDSPVESAMSLEFLVFCAAGLFGIFYIIVPNIMKASQSGLVANTLLVLPVLALPLYTFKKTNPINSLLIVALISFVSYGVCYGEGLHILTNWDKVLRSSGKGVNDFFSKFNEWVKDPLLIR